jgi:SAM-dependent methyltransferase
MMNPPEPEGLDVGGSFDAYWHGLDEAGAFAVEAFNHPSILAFWIQFFKSVRMRYVAPRMIDLASGNGAVVDRAYAVFESDPLSIRCVDISEAAIRQLTQRFPDVDGLVGDVRSVPNGAESFDIVTSQFGVEYGGWETVADAARFLAPGGTLALLLHNSDGAIQAECIANLAAARRLRDSEFIPLAKTMFEAAFDAVEGADRKPYDSAAARLAPAVQAVERLFQEYGEGVAGNAVATLYRGVGRIHQRIQHYDREEVLNWLERMNAELSAYSERMAGMSGASVDRDQFDSICAGLAERGCHIEQAGPFFPAGEDRSLAWALIATMST